MEYQNRDRGVSLTVLAIGLGCVSFFGYWLALLLYILVTEPSSLVWGSLFFFVICAGGFTFGLYCIARLFAQTSYRLGPSILAIDEYMPGRSKAWEVPRDYVEALTCVYTPNRRAGGPDIYKVVVNWTGDEGKSRWVAMEGTTKQEALWIGTILSEWCGKEMTMERSDT